MDLIEEWEIIGKGKIEKRIFKIGLRIEKEIGRKSIENEERGRVDDMNKEKIGKIERKRIEKDLEMKEKEKKELRKVVRKGIFGDERIKIIRWDLGCLKGNIGGNGRRGRGGMRKGIGNNRIGLKENKRNGKEIRKKRIGKRGEGLCMWGRLVGRGGKRRWGRMLKGGGRIVVGMSNKRGFKRIEVIGGVEGDERKGEKKKNEEIEGERGRWRRKRKKNERESYKE